MSGELLQFERPSAREPIAPCVNGEVMYLNPTGEKPAVHIPPPGAGESRRTALYSSVPVPIRDARAVAAALSVDRQGVALRRHDTAVTDFYDDDQVRALYYPEMERLVRRATGASRVLVFDHNTRVDGGAGSADSRTPVRIVHNDYTVRSAPRRVRDLLPNEAEDLLRRRFAVINVWRPIKGPVRRAPLAVIDAQTVADRDLIATDLVYRDRKGEIYEVAASASHRWFYFPHMAHHVVLLIKGYDSMEDGRARFTPHTAFDDTTSPPGAPPRESIEVRTLVFFDQAANQRPTRTGEEYRG